MTTFNSFLAFETERRFNYSWKGYLTFTPINQVVGTIYQSKYGAVGGPTGLMSIGREKSKELIEKYL